MSLLAISSIACSSTPKTRPIVVYESLRWTKPVELQIPPDPEGVPRRKVMVTGDTAPWEGQLVNGPYIAILGFRQDVLKAKLKHCRATSAIQHKSVEEQHKVVFDDLARQVDVAVAQRDRFRLERNVALVFGVIGVGATALAAGLQ